MADQTEELKAAADTEKSEKTKKMIKIAVIVVVVVILGFVVWKYILKK